MKNPELGGETQYSTRIQKVWRLTQTVFNVLNHVMIIFVASFMTYKSYSTGNHIISWHVFLCTLGYQLLMTQSILAFYAQNQWSKQYSRPSQRKFHWVLQAIGSTAALIGMLIEFIDRYRHSRHHFTSTHSIVGLAAGIFTLIGMINGIPALWSFELKKIVRPVYFKLAHNLVGITAFVLGMVSLYYGYNKGYMVHTTHAENRMWLKAFCIITIILSLIGALRSSFNLLRNAFTI